MLKQDIEQQVKEALKSGEKERLSTLRLLLAAVKNEEIASGHEATDEEVMTVARHQIKQRKESAEAFHNAGREELAQKEEAEIEVLNKYIPQQMSEEEVRKVVEEVVSQMPETEKSNFGKVMGQVMGRVKGQADGNLVSKVVKELLQ